jgi:hypothetical protein
VAVLPAADLVRSSRVEALEGQRRLGACAGLVPARGESSGQCEPGEGEQGCRLGVLGPELHRLVEQSDGLVDLS